MANPKALNVSRFSYSQQSEFESREYLLFGRAATIDYVPIAGAIAPINRIDGISYYGLMMQTNSLLRLTSSSTTDFRLAFYNDLTEVKTFIFTGDDIKYYVYKGMVYVIDYNKPKVLICTAVNQSIANNIVGNSFYANRIPGDNCKLLVDEHVITSSIYKKAKHFLVNYFVNDGMSSNIDTIITKSITNKLFNNPNITIQSSSIEEQEYMRLRAKSFAIGSPLPVIPVDKKKSDNIMYFLENPDGTYEVMEADGNNLKGHHTVSKQQYETLVKTMSNYYNTQLVEEKKGESKHESIVQQIAKGDYNYADLSMEKLDRITREIFHSTNRIMGTEDVIFPTFVDSPEVEEEEVVIPPSLSVSEHDGVIPDWTAEIIEMDEEEAELTVEDVVAEINAVRTERRRQEEDEEVPLVTAQDIAEAEEATRWNTEMAARISRENAAARLASEPVQSFGTNADGEEVFIIETPEENEEPQQRPRHYTEEQFRQRSEQRSRGERPEEPQVRPSERNQFIEQMRRELQISEDDFYDSGGDEVF